MNKKATLAGLFIFEITVGLILGALTAVVLLPICCESRGYFAVGSEWILIIGVAYAGFIACNKYIFDRIERSCG